MFWRKASTELSRTALICYLLMQEEGVENVTPSKVQDLGFMTKGAASKAIKELKDKDYLIDDVLFFKEEDNIEWRRKEYNYQTYLVYKHIFPNGKLYYGITCREPEVRWDGGKGYIDNKEMYSDIVKYGWNNIEHEIIATDMNYHEARELEHMLIYLDKDNCYNIKG